MVFFDGEKVYILVMVQKFGCGVVSDQMMFGGFYMMFDENGYVVGVGYDLYGYVYEMYFDLGFCIVDFQFLYMDEVCVFIDEVVWVVLQVQYVGWDIVVLFDGLVFVEGNWGVGVYENKFSVIGICIGYKLCYCEVIGF